jgi:hypothetical protein
MEDAVVEDSPRVYMPPYICTVGVYGTCWTESRPSRMVRVGAVPQGARARERGRTRRTRCHWTAPTACHPTERTLETEPNAGEALGAIDADAAWAPCGHLGCNGLASRQNKPWSETRERGGRREAERRRGASGAPVARPHSCATRQQRRRTWRPPRVHPQQAAREYGG